MCGIIGYCGHTHALPIIIDGLHKLEYRGYDSAGVAYSLPASSSTHTPPIMPFRIQKTVGKIKDLEQQCKNDVHVGNIGIGHCRWATHGTVTWENAHPHISSDKKVVVIHNGIIENYEEIKTKLIELHYSFYSESDTEVIANLLAHLISPHNTYTLEGNASLSMYVRAVLTLRHILKGSFALSIMFSDAPNNIYSIRYESPLIIGVGTNALHVASDIIPLLYHTKSVIYMDNYEVSQFFLPDNKNPILSIFSQDGKQITPNIVHIDTTVEEATKHTYEHFMIKEIYEQPDMFNRLSGMYVDSNSTLPQFTIAPAHITHLKKMSRITFISCGTSYHASLYAANLVEQYIKIPATVEYASEFRYRHPILNKNMLIIGISQSGETADTLAALQLAKKSNVCTLAMTNVNTSSMSRIADIVIHTSCGPEIGVASTKSYTAQLLLLYYFTMYVSYIRKTIPSPQIRSLITHSFALPKLSKSIFAQQHAIIDIGKVYARYQHVLYLGRGLLYQSALEGALKLKELSYIHAEGYAAAEMKHGPIALIDNTMPTIALVPAHTILYEKTQSNIAEVKARGGRILAITHTKDTQHIYDDVLTIPHLSDELDPILFAIILQLFSYYVAISKGFNPDQPRNLAKSVTVE